MAVFDIYSMGLVLYQVALWKDDGRKVKSMPGTQDMTLSRKDLRALLLQEVKVLMLQVRESSLKL